MEMIHLTIDSQAVCVPEGTSIIDAAKKVNVHIPSLCYMNFGEVKMVNKTASCRICVVEIEGKRNLAPSCATPVSKGMKVITNSRRVLKSRRRLLQMMLSDHPNDCLNCAKSTDCELQQLSWEFDVKPQKRIGVQSTYAIDKSSGALKRDPNKCIMCRRCETVCNDVQTVGALTAFGRGFNSIVGPAEMQPLADSNCVYCGQCVSVCPTAALTGVGFIHQTWDALFDPKKTVVAQIAPAVRVAIGEEFGLEAGEIVTGQLVAGIRRLGFDAVFDTTFGADLTIMEEAHEIVERIESNQNLPILTSCCPGWINFIKHHFPKLMYMPSSCKSPQQMTGAVIKEYWAAKKGIAKEDVVVVSVMPCLAKKYEATIPGMQCDVDYVLTTRELSKMLKEGGVHLANQPKESFDDPLGESTGAGVIFGTTGGVLEAALRTIYEQVTGKTLDTVDFWQVRGLAGVKEASVQVNGHTLKVAAASGLGNARKILENIEKGISDYHVIEIMACPGGCINGGGQPYSSNKSSTIHKRMEALYEIDGLEVVRKSHDNESVRKLYDEFLNEPGSHNAHELLHVNYG